MPNASVTKGSVLERYVANQLNLWILKRNLDEKLTKSDMIFTRALGSGAEATVLMTNTEEIRLFKEKHKKGLRLINPKINKEYEDLCKSSPEEAISYKKAVGHLIGHVDEEAYLKLTELLAAVKKEKRKTKKVEVKNAMAVGDIRSTDPRGYDFITKFVIECKNYGSIPWSHLLRNSKGSSNIVMEHWYHLLDTANSYSRIPLLVYRESKVRNSFPYLFICKNFYDRNPCKGTPIAIFPRLDNGKGLVVLDFIEFLELNSYETIMQWN